MTKTEFIKSFELYQKSGKLFSYIYLAIVFGPLISACVLMESSNGVYHTMGTVLAVISIACLFISLPVLSLFTRRKSRQHGLDCPSCDKSIVAISHTVIASGNCGFCGEAILDK
jgi:hypothetical protein